LATEVAVSVIELLVREGSAEGAVYMVEVAGPAVLSEPHAASVAAQVTDHLTPALVESLVMVTAREVVAFTWRVAGTAEEKETEMGKAGDVLIEEEPPQDTTAALREMAKSGTIDLRRRMAGSVWLSCGDYCLRLTQPRSCS
jgi:hypothetical protein